MQQLARIGTATNAAHAAVCVVDGMCSCLVVAMRGVHRVDEICTRTLGAPVTITHNNDHNENHTNPQNIGSMTA